MCSSFPASPRDPRLAATLPRPNLNPSGICDGRHHPRDERQRRGRLLSVSRTRQRPVLTHAPGQQPHSPRAEVADRDDVVPAGGGVGLLTADRLTTGGHAGLERFSASSTLCAVTGFIR